MLSSAYLPVPDTTSTYKVSSVPTATLGRDAEWVRTPTITIASLRIPVYLVMYDSG